MRVYSLLKVTHKCLSRACTIRTSEVPPELIFKVKTLNECTGVVLYTWSREIGQQETRLVFPSGIFLLHADVKKGAKILTVIRLVHFDIDACRQAICSNRLQHRILDRVLHPTRINRLHSNGERREVFECLAGAAQESNLVNTQSWRMRKGRQTRHSIFIAFRIQRCHTQPRLQTALGDMQKRWYTKMLQGKRASPAGHDDQVLRLLSNLKRMWIDLHTTIFLDHSTQCRTLFLAVPRCKSRDNK